MMDAKAEMRVKIARDALAQLRSRPEVRTSHVYHVYMVTVDPLSTFDELLEAPCVVCAIGSMMLGWATEHRGAEWPRRDCEERALWRSDIEERLGAYFSMDELDEIEHAYECAAYLKECAYESKYPAATRYGHCYPNDRVRLEAILENMIRNEGTFDALDLRAGIPEPSVIPTMGECVVLGGSDAAPRPLANKVLA